MVTSNITRENLRKSSRRIGDRLLEGQLLLAGNRSHRRQVDIPPLPKEPDRKEAVKSALRDFFHFNVPSPYEEDKNA